MALEDFKAPPAADERRPAENAQPGSDPSATRSDPAWVDLSSFSNPDYDPGRGLLVRGLWYLLSLAVFESGCLPLSRPKSWLLRWFGARIGEGLVIKPHVRIKYPWRLVLGDHCWLGQNAWIDNIADVEMGDHVCVSQRAYLCTGDHDYRSRQFDLVARPIRIENGVWVGACAIVLGGVTLQANAIVAAGSLVTHDVPAATVVGGHPARQLAERQEPSKE